MERNQPFKQALDKMIDLLEVENRHLKALNFDELPRIAEEKSRVASAIDNHMMSAGGAADFPAHARKIKALSDENQKLLAAVKSGVMSAKVRVQNLMSQAQSVGTYTASGAKLTAPEGVITKHSLA